MEQQNGARQDHLGSIREMTNGSRNVLAQYNYDAFGHATTVFENQNSNFQYSGFYRQRSGQLDIAIYRAYNDKLACWMSRDPIEKRPPTVNLYSYCQNNGLILVDPTGLSSIGEDIAEAAVELAKNQPNDFNNIPPDYYTCVIFINKSLRKARISLAFPNGANPNTVKDLCCAMEESPDFEPIPPSSKQPKKGDIIIFKKHSGIVTSDAGDVTYGGSTKTGNVDTTPLDILMKNPDYAGKPKKIFRCCKKKNK